MLDQGMKQQLQGLFANIKEPIELSLSLDDSKKAEELKQLASELVALSDKISLADSDVDGALVPSFAVAKAGEAPRIRFAGVPMGHEFNSLILALLQTGGHPTKVDEDLVEQIAGLEGEYNFEVFISLSCQNCPEVVQAINVMSVLNPNITATMIDGAVFPQLVEDRNIMAVPSLHLNGQSLAQGRISLADIVRKIDSNADKKAAEKLSQKDTFDFLVVGGGPAGSAAAVYAARKGISTGVVSERFGGQVADTMGIENFISVSYTEGPKLVSAMENHVKDYDVDVMDNQRAAGLKTVEEDGKSLVEISLENGAKLRSKSVLLATGARWRNLGVKGEAEYKNKGVAYCPHCDGPLFKGKHVAVIGGGNSGVEAAIDLAGIVQHVTLIEFDTQLRADEVLQKKLRSLNNVTIITNAATTEITGDGERVNGLVYKDRADDSEHSVELAGVFIQIGLVPNSEWLKDSVDLTKYGEIIIDDRGQTNIPGVFAAGDVTTKPYKQIIISMGEGANAALAAFDYLIRSY